MLVHPSFAPFDRLSVAENIKFDLLWDYQPLRVVKLTFRDPSAQDRHEYCPCYRRLWKAAHKLRIENSHVIKELLNKFVLICGNR
jgi:hypothetical protein